MATTPLFAPDGSVRNVPEDQLDAALRSGGKRAVRMSDPTGSLRWVPEDKVNDAVAAGGKRIAGEERLTLPTTPERPGLIKRFAQSVGLPSSKEELETMKPPTLGEMTLNAVMMGAPMAYKMVKGVTSNLKERGREAWNEWVDVGENLASGGPIGANLGKAGAAYSDLLLKGVAAPVGGGGVANFGEDVAQGNVPGAIGSGAGTVVNALLLKGGKRPAKVPERLTPPVSPMTESTLAERGISLTAGERSSPGFVSNLEPRAAQTGLATGPTARFLKRRQAGIQGWADQLAQKVGGELSTENPLPSQETLGQRIREGAQQELDTQRGLDEAAKARVGEDITGVHGASQREHGETILGAVRNQHAAVDALEAEAFSQVREAAEQAGVQLEWSNAKEVAQRLYDGARKSELQGRSPFSSEVMGVLKRIAGQENPEAMVAKQFGWDPANLSPYQKGEVDKFLKANPDMMTGGAQPFGVMADARTGVMQIKRTLEAAKIESPSIGALKALDKAMTTDLEAALPTDIKSGWASARAITREQASQFNSKFLKSLMRSDNPMAGERVIDTLMRKGTDTDARNLMRVIGDDAQAMGSTRRASVDWLMQNSRNASDALTKLGQRPGMKAILGEQYGELERVLEGMRRAEIAPASPEYQAFLKQAAGQNFHPEALVQHALTSPAYADSLAQLSRFRPSIKGEVASDMFQRLLNDATENGTFGSQGAHFNPVKFADAYSASRPSLAKFIDPSTLLSLDEFSEGMKQLKLSDQISLTRSGSIASQFESLGALRYFGSLGKAGVGGAIALMFTGHLGFGLPLAAAGGISHMTPRWFTQIALSPRGAKLLSEGFSPRMLNTARQAKWAADLALVAAQVGSRARVEERKRKAASYSSVDDVMEAAKRGDISPSEANSLTLKMKGRGSLLHPLPPPE